MSLVGIDLGTTHSSAAVMGPDGPVLVPNALGEYLTPSAAAITDSGEALVGQLARESVIANPDSGEILFKRRMGLDWKRKIGRIEITPQMLSGLVLRSLAADARIAVGHDVTRAVVTVPAYFNDAQRQATIDAGRIAGLEVERILNEPTAAALAYGLHAREDEHHILVFDLGGGTFDVSVLECADGVLEVQASAGEAFLGGEDFTRRLLLHVLKEADIELESFEKDRPELAARLRHRVEIAKRRLSREESVEIEVPDPGAPEWTLRRSVSVSRAAFDEVNRELRDCFDKPLWRALRDAKVDPKSIDEVLLVGGATRMPMVREYVRSVFEKEPRTDVDPDTVVALGAAVQAGLIEEHTAVEDIVATDVMPHTLGIETAKRLAGRIEDGYYMPMIERNSTIPTSRIDRLVTMFSGQTVMKITVYQGESRRVKDNLRLGELAVAGLPPAPAGSVMVDVRFTYDLNGILEVEASVVGDPEEKVERLVLQNRPGKLDNDAVAAALQSMQTLKHTARDEEENRVVLDRAHRVYAETIGDLRSSLAEKIDFFEDALARQDPELIEASRRDLEIYLSFLEGTEEV